MANEFPGGGLDRELALSRMGGDAELLKEIAALFIEDYPKGVAEIRAALAVGDAKTVERAAHGLKGSVGTFGARAAMDLAFEVEQSAHAKELERAKQALGRLEKVLTELRTELTAL